MSSRDGRRAYLGFQWDPGSWENAPLWLDALSTDLSTRFPGRPVHWNLPAVSPDMPARRRASAVKALSARMESAGDLVTSMGYAGACHPLLNLDELEKELAWGLKNPWGTGLTDLFDSRPAVLVPQLADLLRPDAARLYRAHGFSLVGVCWEPGGDSRGRPAAPAGRRAPLPPPAGWVSIARIRVATAAQDDTLRKSMRRLGQGGNLFLLLDLSGVTSIDPVEETLEQVSAAFSGSPGPEVLNPPPAGTAADSSPPWQADWTPFAAPLLHARLAGTAGLARKKRKRTEELQDILSRMATGEAPAAAAPEKGDGSQNSLRLVAHMLGDVVLAGSSFDVCLAGGRFCGITRRGRDLVPRLPALSSLRVAGRTLAFRTTSSFSFEGEHGTGLREELGLDGRQEAGISIEYSFRNDSPRLSISGEIRCPQITGPRSVDEYAPLEIALRMVAPGQTAEVTAMAPDGSAFTAGVPRSGAAVILPGAIHRIPRPDGGWVELCYSCPGEGLWGIPSFRILRRRGRSILVVNPFGSYAPLPAPVLSGRRETFSVLLGVEDA